MARWGLIPSWAKDPSIGARMINARAETLSEKPAFRTAFRRRRCLIPADGFYEWHTEAGKKQPYRISFKDGEPFAFAGLWEDWLGPDGSEVESCTIVTTDAVKAIADIHHRMPVILDAAAFEDWLTGPVEAAGRWLRPYAGNRDLHADRITNRVNNVRNDGPELWERAPDTADDPAVEKDGSGGGQMSLF